MPLIHIQILNACSRWFSQFISNSYALEHCLHLCLQDLQITHRSTWQQPMILQGHFSAFLIHMVRDQIITALPLQTAFRSLFILSCLPAFGHTPVAIPHVLRVNILNLCRYGCGVKCRCHKELCKPIQSSFRVQAQHLTMEVGVHHACTWSRTCEFLPRLVVTRDRGILQCTSTVTALPVAKQVASWTSAAGVVLHKQNILEQVQYHTPITWFNGKTWSKWIAVKCIKTAVDACCDSLHTALYTL